MWECPDLFELTNVGTAAARRRACRARKALSQNTYSCGSAFGRFPQHVRSARSSRLDCGFDFYARRRAFSDGARRHPSLGWMGMPDAPLRQSRDRRVRLAAPPDRAARADRSAAAGSAPLHPGEGAGAAAQRKLSVSPENAAYFRHGTAIFAPEGLCARRGRVVRMER